MVIKSYDAVTGCRVRVIGLSGILNCQKMPDETIYTVSVIYCLIMFLPG